VDVLIGWPGGDWQATARLAATLVIGYLALMWLASVIWVYRDITSRTRDPISQLVILSIVVVLPIIGLPIYLALRPPETCRPTTEIEQEAILADIQTTAACPSCRRPAEPTFRVCAYCGTTLKEPCPRCNELMLHAWRYCPHCATPRAVAPTPINAPLRAPAPRLDFSTGDDAYYDEPAARASASVGDLPSSATPPPARPALRRRPVRTTNAPEGDPAPRGDTPRPTVSRRPASEE
jgi:hypothetical protein